MALRLRAVAGRAGWNLADQIVSSATNAALSFVVARSVDQVDFGGFAVAFTVFSLAVGVSRAISTSPLGMRFADAADDPFRAGAAAATGTAFVLGLVIGVGALAVSVPLGGAAGTALAAVGVVMPGLLVQDAWRYVFFAAARPAAALVNDLAWAALQTVTIGALLLGHVPRTALLVLAWGLSAVAAAALGARQARTSPRPRRARSWWRDHRDVSAPLVGEFVTVQSGQQTALLLVAAVGSLEALGALRGAQVLIGPIQILVVAALGFAVPELSRRRDGFTRRHWLQASLALSLVVAGLGSVWGAILLLVPDGVGSALLGETWPAVDAVLWPTVVAQVAAALGIGPSVALIAMQRTRLSFLVSAVEAPLLLGGGVVGVLVDGAVGASWGFAVAFATLLPVVWLLVAGVAHRRSPLTSDRESGGAHPG